MFLRKRFTRKLEIPELPEVDHSLASAAIDNAVAAHQVAQVQGTQAKQIAAELQRVNLRNGFAPAIRDSFNRELGGAL
jgi:hypothetical protein